MSGPALRRRVGVFGREYDTGERVVVDIAEPNVGEGERMSRLRPSAWPNGIGAVDSKVDACPAASSLCKASIMTCTDAIRFSWITARQARLCAWNCAGANVSWKSAIQSLSFKLV